jgi:dCMP deaminase
MSQRTTTSYNNMFTSNTGTLAVTPEIIIIQTILEYLHTGRRKNVFELGEEVYEAALEFAEESKCAAKKVACILVKDNSIIVIGINGSASKADNCCDIFRKFDGKWFKALDGEKWKLCEDQREHYGWSSEYEAHAEINALSRAGTGAKGAAAYITHSPCLDCVKALGAFGIAKVYYNKEFDNFEKAEMTLKRYGATIEKLII